MEKQSNLIGLIGLKHKLKHTPGPWGQDMKMVLGADGREICRVQMINVGKPGMPKYDGEQMRANLQLLSASPNLLRGLIQAVVYFNDNGGDADYTWLPELKAAIVEATGVEAWKRTYEKE